MLVVGVGSTLRRDDAIGRVVAEAVADLRLPGVVVQVVTQLVPELVEVMADAERVVIVDADVNAELPQLLPVNAGDAGPLTHHGRPETLMALGEAAGFAVPPIFSLGMPARDLGFGSDLSPESVRHVEAAVGLIREMAGTDSHIPVPPGDIAR